MLKAGTISGVSSIALIANVPETPVTSQLYMPEKPETPTTTKGPMRVGAFEEGPPRYSEMSIANTV